MQIPTRRLGIQTRPPRGRSGYASGPTPSPRGSASARQGADRWCRCRALPGASGTSPRPARHWAAGVGGRGAAWARSSPRLDACSSRAGAAPRSSVRRGLFIPEGLPSLDVRATRGALPTRGARCCIPHRLLRKLRLYPAVYTATANTTTLDSSHPHFQALKATHCLSCSSVLVFLSS